MEKMKEIKTKEDFLKWAHDVNLSCESKRNGICDLQDVFYRGQDAEMKQLKTWFLEMSQTEKQLLTFSIIKAMGEEMAYKFIKAWAKRQANLAIEEYQADIEKEYQKLAADRMAFNETVQSSENAAKKAQDAISQF